MSLILILTLLKLGKMYRHDIPIVSDSKEALVELINQTAESPEHDEWIEKLTKNKQEYPLWYKHSQDGMSSTMVN